mgnify:CR=1 FL=1
MPKAVVWRVYSIRDLPKVLEAARRWMLMNDEFQYNSEDDYTVPPSKYIFKIERKGPFGGWTVVVGKVEKETSLKGLLLRESGYDGDRFYERSIVLAKIESIDDVEELVKFIHEEDEFEVAQKFIESMKGILPITFKIVGGEGYFRVTVWE